MSIYTLLEEMKEWLISLPPEFAFLLALPFVIAIAAFAQDALRRSKRNRGKTHRRDGAPRRWGRTL